MPEIPAEEQIDEFAPFRELIDDEGIPMVGVRVVVFLDQDGTEQFRVKADGEARLSTTLGLLEYAKAIFIDYED